MSGPGDGWWDKCSCGQPNRPPADGGAMTETSGGLTHTCNEPDCHVPGPEDTGSESARADREGQGREGAQ